MNGSVLRHWGCGLWGLVFVSGCTTSPPSQHQSSLTHVSQHSLLQNKPVVEVIPPVLMIKPLTQKKPHKKIYGKASFYANMFQGRKTANGQIFDQGKLTAAHRTLAFGTKVKVTNVSNHKSVIVTVNDRGPFIRGRMIDLSKSAFKAIGNTRTGILNVTMEILK